MASGFYLLVKILGVAHMGSVKCLGKRIFFFGDGDKMHMVLHKAIGKYGEAVF